MSYPPQPPPYGYPAYGAYGAPDHPQSTTILILGILSLVLCQLMGPFAWVMGKRALNEIDASGGTIGGRGNVNAGYICGIIATALMALSLLFLLLMLVLALAGAFAGSSSSY
ncbi:DUF4190 domain-containing protein [Nocardia beijingensis]|uniref:DUF4190 domain-containing protein n=1 Tax=Nocardia implantans TaxID=3108168 RepID=A0ABU6AM90_9NOCA|nr:MULTISPECIES: DUF4190 domain-containing protein [Nocardia]MBF6193409.1 DUF4190 domain-containing protein [Nocardia beijingensis]MEA3532678.1 DUF4190 domain-containing protein [Nocardia sp. CDC192]MEB3508510.1 DUF4190 domain-containing protein [Nocardia sp. CDC186]